AEAAAASTAAAIASASAAPAASAATVTAAAASPPLSAASSVALRAIPAGNVRCACAVEIRLGFGLVREIATAFDDDRTGGKGLTLGRCRRFSAATAAHLGALLFQNR